MMQIGPYRLGPGAVLSPMAGITNPPYRQLCQEMGACLTPTELISSFGLVYFSRRPKACSKRLSRETRLLLQSFPGEYPYTVQLFGREPEQMAEAARVAASLGAHVVDLNFSCPARKVVKNGEGAGVALMRDLDQMARIARLVVDAVPVPVTAKIRAGYSHLERNAPEAAKRLEQAGISAICVHARTRDQVHSGPVDLPLLRTVCRSVQIPIIGNGGIRSLADAQEMMAATGCAKVAIGQAAKGNPWIFQQMAGAAFEVNLEERIRLCRRHFDLYLEWVKVEKRAVLEMRKHASWYMKGFKGAAAFRQKLAEVCEPDAFVALLELAKAGALELGASIRDD